jgi:hypothetical protein
MKIGGLDPKLLPPEAILVLPRVGSDIVLRARGLPDMDEFYKLCPEPVPPALLTKEGKKPDLKDTGYLQQEAEHRKRRWGYIVVKSLEPSEVEWDTVKLDNPASWANWDDDLKANGFTAAERNRVFSLCLEANSLDERKIQQARELFLAGRPDKAQSSSSPSIGQPTTQSGERVPG